MKPFIYLSAILYLSSCGVEDSPAQLASADSEYVQLGIQIDRADVKESVLKMSENPNSIYSQASVDGLLALLGGGYDERNQKLLESYLGKSLSEASKKSTGLQVEKEGITIKTANNLWARPYFSIKEGYLDYLNRNYNGLQPGVLDVDPLTAATDVNKWAAQNTNEMISEVVTPDMLGPQTVMILANALYFKGEWENQFDETSTQKRDFNVVSKEGEKSTEQVDMMQKFGNKISISQLSAQQTGLGQDVTVVRLPYKGDGYAMYLAFASKLKEEDFSFRTSVDTETNINDVYRNLIANGRAFEQVYQDKKFLNFSMPKFTVESTFSSLQTPLIQAGLGPLFSGGALAGLSDDPRAQLSFIIQKAKIIVNEEGSEAAAVTVGGIRTTSLGPKGQVLHIDGPFAYAIQDEVQGVTLFEGIIRKPEVKD